MHFSEWVGNENFCVEAEAEAEFMEGGADAEFGGGVFAANAGHVPGATFFGETIFRHVTTFQTNPGNFNWILSGGTNLGEKAGTMILALLGLVLTIIASGKWVAVGVEGGQGAGVIGRCLLLFLMVVGLWRGKCQGGAVGSFDVTFRYAKGDADGSKPSRIAFLREGDVESEAAEGWDGGGGLSERHGSYPGGGDR